jgi:serine phosphatase RsbU (regulator of sigma subunit)
MALLGAGAVAVFAFLYRGTNSANFEQHAKTVAAIQRANHLEAVTRQQVLSAQAGLVNNYDPLARTLAESKENDEVIAKLAGPGLATEVAAVRQAHADQRARVERFQSANSVLRNSLLYLPFAAEDLNRAVRASASPQAASLTGDIDALVLSTLVYHDTGSKKLEARQREQVKSLRARKGEFAESVRGDLDLLLAHATAVATSTTKVDSATAGLLDDSTLRPIADLDQVYVATFDRATARAQMYKDVLYGWAALLAIFAVVFAYKLRRLYSRLEAMVAERTNELNAALRELWGEMELARKIQTALVPRDPALDGCDVASVMKPADQVGGDYYDVFRTGDREWIAMGDVSGHGVPAGLVMMMTQTAIRTAVHADPTASPARVLDVVNRTLTENIRRLGDDKYVTLQLLRRDPDGTIQFSGQHQDLLVYRAENASVETIACEGPWIGLMDEIGPLLTDQTFKLGSDDVLLLHTDGVTEAKRGGTMLDATGLSELLAQNAASSSGQLVSAILTRLEQYEVFDDVAIVAIKSAA